MQKKRTRDDASSSSSSGDPNKRAATSHATGHNGDAATLQPVVANHYNSRSKLLLPEPTMEEMQNREINCLVNCLDA
jgi:hypothetical protein